MCMYSHACIYPVTPYLHTTGASRRTSYGECADGLAVFRCRAKDKTNPLHVKPHAWSRQESRQFRWDERVIATRCPELESYYSHSDLLLYSWVQLQAGMEAEQIREGIAATRVAAATARAAAATAARWTAAARAA